MASMGSASVASAGLKYASRLADALDAAHLRDTRRMRVSKSSR